MGKRKGVGIRGKVEKGQRKAREGRSGKGKEWNESREGEGGRQESRRGVQEDGRGGH